MPELVEGIVTSTSSVTGESDETYCYLIINFSIIFP